MTKKELKELIKEVISESIYVGTILSKLKSTQDDVRGVNVSETKYYGPGEEEWIKKYDRGFGMFLVLPKNSNAEYYSASIIPLNKEMTSFDLNINYDDVYYVTFAGSINIVVKKTSKIPEKYPKWATITRGSELKFHYQ